MSLRLWMMTKNSSIVTVLFSSSFFPILAQMKVRFSIFCMRWTRSACLSATKQPTDILSCSRSDQNKWNNEKKRLPMSLTRVGSHLHEQLANGFLCSWQLFPIVGRMTCFCEFSTTKSPKNSWKNHRQTFGSANPIFQHVPLFLLACICWRKCSWHLCVCLWWPAVWKRLLCPNEAKKNPTDICKRQELNLLTSDCEIDLLWTTDLQSQKIKPHWRTSLEMHIFYISPGNFCLQGFVCHNLQNWASIKWVFVPASTFFEALEFQSKIAAVGWVGKSTPQQMSCSSSCDGNNCDDQ